MSISVAAIFKGCDSTLKIAKYLGMIESTDCKVNRLINMHRKAAEMALGHAQNVDIHSKAFNTYLNRAAEKYLDAIAVATEREELFTSYIGLAFCNHLLLDNTNMEINIIKAIGLYKYVKDLAKMKVDSLFDMYDSEADAWVVRIASLGLASLINQGCKALEQSQINDYKAAYNRMSPIGEELLVNFYYLDTDENHGKYYHRFF